MSTKSEDFCSTDSSSTALRPGCRPLTNEEIFELREYFNNLIGSEKDKRNLAKRNFTLIFFGLYTGFRISEILSLKVSDIIERNKIRDTVMVSRNNMKGKKASRRGVINDDLKKILTEYLDHYSYWSFPEKRLFSFRTGRMAEYIYLNTFRECNFVDSERAERRLSTHSTRKTFAKACYDSVGKNILDLQACMGHKSISSTQSYVSFDNEKVNNALSKLDFLTRHK